MSLGTEKTNWKSPFFTDTWPLNKTPDCSKNGTGEALLSLFKVNFCDGLSNTFTHIVPLKLLNLPTNLSLTCPFRVMTENAFTVSRKALSDLPFTLSTAMICLGKAMGILASPNRANLLSSVLYGGGRFFIF